MKILIVGGIVFALVAVYVVAGRTYLKSQSWMQWWYGSKIGEWIEINLWKKSETILWSRFLILAGAIPPVLEQLEKLNIPAIEAILPDELRGVWTLAFVAIGIINEMLRNRTTKPIEVVALPDEKPTEVAQAIAHAEAATVVAVAIVEGEKARGAL